MPLTSTLTPPHSLLHTHSFTLTPPHSLTHTHTLSLSFSLHTQDQDRRRREKAAGSVGASNVASVFTPVRDLKGKGAGDFDGDLKALVHTGTASVEEHVQVG